MTRAGIANAQRMDLAELRRLAEAATPGPWFRQGGMIHGPDKGGIDIGPIRAIVEPDSDANARYIATANPATILALLDLLAGMVDCLRWEVDGHPVKYPIIPAGNGHRFSEAATAAWTALAASPNPEGPDPASNEPPGTMWVERNPEGDRAWVKTDSGEWKSTTPPPPGPTRKDRTRNE